MIYMYIDCGFVAKWLIYVHLVCDAYIGQLIVEWIIHSVQHLNRHDCKWATVWFQ